jgi:hypothetical protein
MEQISRETAPVGLSLARAARDESSAQLLYLYPDGRQCDAQPQDLNCLSSKCSIAVDRSMRSWEWLTAAPPRFVDPVSGIEVWRKPSSMYVPDAAIHLARSADVWRFITALVLESWPSNKEKPGGVWIDAREIADNLYAKPMHGGTKSEHLLTVAGTVETLKELEIRIPTGTIVLPFDPQTGKHKKTKAERLLRCPILLIDATEEVRTFAGYALPLRWHIHVSDWSLWYPRQFAPLFRTLVELSASSATDRWVKSIGTELSYHYREDNNRGPNKVLSVNTIFRRACLTDEVSDQFRNRNGQRAWKYFHQALDELGALGVLQGWRFHPDDVPLLRYASRGWQKRWLETRVQITAPAQYVKKLGKEKA